MPLFRRRLKTDEHQWVQDRLSLYLDGRLDPGERARVEAHLRDCATCARSWETLRWTVQALRALPPVRAPRSFALRPEQVARVPQPVGWLRRTAWAMAAALILVLGLDFALSLGRIAPGPAMAPAVAPAAPAPQAEREALRAMEMEDHTRSPEPSPAPMFGLAVPQATPTTAAEQLPGPEEIPPPSAPAFPLSPLRILEFLLLLGAIGLLALDRWRSQRPR
ncbi:anti-sigma factor [Thermoflexus sp.]|uniref:anti-sigma factor family protein n=1 Tax=Thermoflexus sp. TaxID=1969742 RepID=UPI0025DCFD9E|nr:zf-HC2 domain-containing protein [Thermoflexus sp.]MDW8064054.1 zf-HC2 domain-containing protein [Anaerolineae bacterium]MCS6964108.1 zf-HC2 domain-containing protein [Thermoflexus sp.]MCS7349986.1 zf-HC2 domain-containing protein [Thermoflexus sp.]MCX7690164.1 zf-HC2 domain-containing protein [Thermoflexus sp.]MDW8179434.1 zf-HC2 domain-containing protein [Anaerolineae bacterium]